MIGFRICCVLFFVYIFSSISCSTGLNKTLLKEQTLEMFRHAYWSYMDHAFPADELMPLSCKGRYRGVTPCRGDVDDALGNFSLTLVDSLDTLIVIGEFDEFERASRLVVESVQFDSDIEVSVFETNIRMVGGLISAHLLAKLLQQKQPRRMPWYSDQMLYMAKDIADRLLPAFNTSSGVPYPKVNLRYGLVDKLRQQQDTCTACGGTMILEFAALTRLTGDVVYEERARKAMDFLWQQRHRNSDLMGTVLNVHNGDWVRRDSGIGAGIDSYYEYCLKAYVLLGDELYLDRFNKHYDAVMKYMNRGPLFFDVHMHRPTITSRPFMDSLLAFWPGLQVLKGDLKPAIETHEMLYQVMQKHNFLPEAFTHDFQVHWGQHPLRPELVESTYFLYKATKDEHYLEVARLILNSLEKFVRLPCGFAAIKDVRTMAHEDRMDSFVLAETFKYLYMMFVDPNDLLFDPDNYVFTTEAHLLPLSIASTNRAQVPTPIRLLKNEALDPMFSRSCPNTQFLYKGEMSTFAYQIRSKLKNLVRKSTSSKTTCSAKHSGTHRRLKASEFSASNAAHVTLLRKMGISIVTQSDGRMQLSHTAALAETQADADEGLVFMQEMILLTHKQEEEVPHPPRVVQVTSAPIFGSIEFVASPGLFGKELDGLDSVEGRIVMADPFRACSPLTNAAQIEGKIAFVERSDCMFQEKVRFAEQAGAIGVIVGDHYGSTMAENSPLFAMSGDNKGAVHIPAVFLFGQEAFVMRTEVMQRYPDLTVRIGCKMLAPRSIFVAYLKQLGEPSPPPECLSNEARTYTVLIDGKERTCTEEDGNYVCVEGSPDDGSFTLELMDREAFIERTKNVRANPLRRALDKQKNVVKNRVTPRAPRDIIKVTKTSDRKQMLSFDLGSLIPPNGVKTQKERNALIEQLYLRLIEETNIDELENRDAFLIVAGKMVLRTLGTQISISEQEEALFAEMAYLIKLKRLEEAQTVGENGVKCVEDADGDVHCEYVGKP